MQDSFIEMGPLVIIDKKNIHICLKKFSEVGSNSKPQSWSLDLNRDAVFVLYTPPYAKGHFINQP